MLIRTARADDLDEIAAIEAECFPPEQAAPKESIRKRLAVFPDRFILLCDDSGKIVSFADGMLTDEPDLTDEMYSSADMHDPNGRWQMIFGLNTRPESRRNGYAGTVMREFTAKSCMEGRSGIVLTCKQQLISFYEKLGFVNEGVTEKSVIGGQAWYQMRLVF